MWWPNLNLNVVVPWQNWYLPINQQVGGRIQIYNNNMTFTTVRGAGHMVPQWRRAEAQFMFQHFVFNLNFTPNTNLTGF